MSRALHILAAAAAALALASCAKPASEPVAAAPPAEPAAATVEDVAPPAPQPLMAPDADLAPVGSASVTVSVKDNVPYFASSSYGWVANHSGQGGIVLNSGDIDLSTFPAGDVLITATIDDLAYGAGYRFSADGWQAVAIAIDPPGAPVAPTPVFGQPNWPAEFQPPVVTPDQRSVSWTDLDSDQNVYEYSLAIAGPNGVVVLDPKIKPGGSTGQ